MFEQALTLCALRPKYFYEKRHCHTLRKVFELTGEAREELKNYTKRNFVVRSARLAEEKNRKIQKIIKRWICCLNGDITTIYGILMEKRL
jgi:hypothetical protein